MSKETIHVGLIGAGANTKSRHISGFNAQPDVEIAAVANRTRDSGERVAGEFDIPTVYDDWLELIEDDSIDAVCIGTWPYLHAPATIAALESDKHVLVEARMAMDSSEAHDMLSTSMTNPHLVAQIVPAPHTLPIDQTVIDLISDGYIGDLITVRLRHTGAGGFPDRDRSLHWRDDRDFSGNNVMQLGIWYEVLMRWIGPASSVQAVGQVVVKHRKNADGRRMAMSIPDHLDIICDMAVGGTASIMVSTVSGLVPDVDMWLIGTEGTLHIDSPDASQAPNTGLRISGGRRGDIALAEIPVAEDKRGGWRVEEEFINAIRGVERVTHTSFTDGVKYMEFTDAVAMSWQLGERVSLPL